MKKYKLIKDFPTNKLKVGSIVKEDKLGQFVSDNCTILEKKEVEEYPEYWEEMVDYPIGTKVYNSQTNTIYTKKEDGWYKPMEKTAYTDEMVSNEKHLTLLDKDEDEDVDPNPLNLEVGKEYILKYIHCNSNPKKVLITHFTKNGHPWGKELHGIVTPGSYELIEEVVKKDYEILSLIYKDNKKLCYLDKRDGFYKYKGHFNYLREGESNLKACLENNWSIHSVKRLYDSEVFTVGDRIENTNYPHINDKIYEISLVDNKIRVYYQGYDYLENISHCKQVLLETEDGVDIFEGDRYYWINKNNYEIKLNRAKTEDFHNSKLKGFNVLKVYSNKQAAEEYKLLNYKGLSVNDVQNKIFNIIGEPYNSNIIRKLKELVKSKFNDEF